jgi:hypothetical protein
MKVKLSARNIILSIIGISLVVWILNEIDSRPYRELSEEMRRNNAETEKKLEELRKKLGSE